jgi:hypothetical protein
MYRILLERAAEKDLCRLSFEIHDRVIVAIQALATNPRPPGCRKLAGSKLDWRIQVRSSSAWFAGLTTQYSLTPKRASQSLLYSSCVPIQFQTKVSEVRK